MSNLYREKLKTDVEEKQKELEVKVDSLSKEKSEEYQKNLKLYESTKGIIEGENEKIKSRNDFISYDRKESKKMFLILLIVSVILIIASDSLIEKLGITIFLFFIYLKDKFEYLLSDARINNLLTENNIAVLNNDIKKIGVSNIGYQVRLHNEFWKYLDNLRSQGKSEEEIDKDELLEEKMNLMKLNEIENLLNILNYIEN